MDRDAPLRPLVFVTVATDHHPFDRLIDSVDRWSDPGRSRARILIQHGTSKTPRSGAGAEYLTYPDMHAALRETQVVVSHGGTATIMLALAHGKRPIVVPRRGSLGEHVDDHQLVFAERLASHGAVHLAKDEDGLFELLGDALESPADFRAPHAADSRRAVEQVAELVEALVGERRRHHEAAD